MPCREMFYYNLSTFMSESNWSFHLYLVGKLGLGIPLFSKSLVQKTVGAFPFIRFSAHIQLSHDKVEIGSKKEDKKDIFHLAEVEVLAYWNGGKCHFSSVLWCCGLCSFHSLHHQQFQSLQRGTLLAHHTCLHQYDSYFKKKNHQKCKILLTSHEN